MNFRKVEFTLKDGNCGKWQGVKHLNTFFMGRFNFTFGVINRVFRVKGCSTYVVCVMKYN